LSVSGCENNVEKALNSIDKEDLAEYVSILASDSLMGRKPFTKGEELTIHYLASQFERIGLEPLFGDDYVQDVKLIEISTHITRVNLKTKEYSKPLQFPDEIAVSSKSLKPEIKIDNSELVFVGFGIVAPEYNWNDYKNLDVKNKTVVVLVNDPGLYTENPDLFKANTMTYYGRWTYKYEEAERQGAAGIIIIHDDLGAGYSYDVPRKSALGTDFFLDNGKLEKSSLLFNGWINGQTANEMFLSLGYNLDSLKTKALLRDFSPFGLPATISMQIQNTYNYNISKNVGGYIKGVKKPEECIIYTAHWDHFGIGEPEKGDSIYNGAVDNGTSLAWMLEIAEAFIELHQKPDRSIVFMAPTAEEQGLLGSSWYVENAPFEAEKTLANIGNYVHFLVKTAGHWLFLFLFSPVPCNSL
jgi:hypothetical protein